MKTCMFKVGRRPAIVGYNVYPLTPAYVCTATWVVAKGSTSTTLPWSVYHAATGAYVWPCETKRHAEYLALALGEDEPFDVTAAVAWARAHYDLEKAQKALDRAKKKAEKEEADGTT